MDVRLNVVQDWFTADGILYKHTLKLTKYPGYFSLLPDPHIQKFGMGQLLPAIMSGFLMEQWEEKAIVTAFTQWTLTFWKKKCG